MPPRRTVRQGRNFGSIFIPLLVILMLGAGVGGTLWGTGFFETGPEEISREGQIAYPAIARPVRAYDAITRDDLIDPNTGQLSVIWLREEQANPAMLRDLSKIIGRVVSRDKAPGYVLTERDMLPVGTRPGIAAGIPPGKRSITISVEDVPGLELLKQGDMFDLLAVLPQQEQTVSNIEEAALLGGVKPPDTRSGQLARQTGIKPLVVGGTMVVLTQGKDRSTDGAEGLVVDVSEKRSNKTPTPQKLATIAVDPVEVTPLTEALGLDLDLYCVTRSGHPEDRDESETTVSFEGMVPVVTLARPVSAYSAISQEDLADTVTGQLNIFYFKPEDVQPGWITGFAELNGRVPARHLSRGSVIRESDLLEPGTRPGISGAVPKGMVAVSVPVDAIDGLKQMTAGDLFEIHSQLPGEFRPTATAPTLASIHGGSLPDEDARLQSELQTGIRVLAKQAQLLMELSDDADGKVAIAVPEADALRVEQSLKLNLEMFVVTKTAEGSGVQDSQQAGPTALKESQHPGDKTQPAQTPIRFAAQQQLVQNSDKSDVIEVPILVKEVPSRKLLTVDHFIEPSTGKVRYLEFKEGQVPENVVRDLRELLGKRAGKSLMAGSWVLQGDVSDHSVMSLPNDIPADWSVIEVSSLQVRGLGVIEVGDRIDLIAARPILSIAPQFLAEWPLKQGLATFHNPDREDIFTQADVAALSSEAVVVFKEERVISVPVKSSEEMATTETQVGETLKREGVTKKETIELQKRDVIVCHVALPVKSIPLLTEALAVQSIVPENDRSRSDRGNGDDANGNGAGNAEKPDRNIDHEVAIYAILRNPDSSRGINVPQRDIVSSWMNRWGQQFATFMDEFEPQAERVKPIERIRGDSVSKEFWKSGQRFDQFPEGIIEDQTVRSIIRTRSERGEK